jgi:hypothetical protein
MRSEQSYRVSKNKAMAAHLGLTSIPVSIPAWNEITTARRRGDDPYAILDAIVNKYGIDNIHVQDCVRAIGAGSSPWIQISDFLMRPAATV